MRDLGLQESGDNPMHSVERCAIYSVCINMRGLADCFLLALGDWSMLQLLLMELGVATVPVVCLLVVHMPAQPVSPPSEAARLVEQAHEDGTQQDSFNSVLRHCYQLLRCALLHCVLKSTLVSDLIATANA